MISFCGLGLLVVMHVTKKFRSSYTKQSDCAAAPPGVIAPPRGDTLRSASSMFGARLYPPPLTLRSPSIASVLPPVYLPNYVMIHRVKKCSLVCELQAARLVPGNFTYLDVNPPGEGCRWETPGRVFFGKLRCFGCWLRSLPPRWMCPPPT